MPPVISRRVLNADAADALLNGPNGLLTPRSDIVLEQAEGEARFTAVEGPVEHYRRTVTVEPIGSDQVEITERFDYRLSIPVWWVLFTIPFSRALCRGRDLPWWHPPDRFTERQARVVALLAILGVAAGFLGTLLGQTITFAADEFKVGESAQGLALSLVRLSILITLVVAALGDRKGRRRTLLYAAAGSILAAAATSLVPNLATLATVQAVSRGTVSRHGPAHLCVRSRGSTSRFPGLCGLHAGAGPPVWARDWLWGPCLSPTSALRDGGSRLWPRWRRCPWWRSWPDGFPSPSVSKPLADSREPAPPEQYRFRLMILAVTSFAVLVFSAPASQLQNEFLNEQRDFSATKIAVFTLLTTWTAGPGMLIAGKLADLRGRRVIAAVGVSGGSIFILWHFTQAGWPMVGVYRSGSAVDFLNGAVAGGVSSRDVRNHSPVGVQRTARRGRGFREHGRTGRWGLHDRDLGLRHRLLHIAGRPTSGRSAGAVVLPRDHPAITGGAQPRRL